MQNLASGTGTGRKLIKPLSSKFSVQDHLYLKSIEVVVRVAEDKVDRLVSTVG